MCYNGKCMHCLEVETGSLIYAIFHVISTSLGCVVSLGMFIYINMAVHDMMNSTFYTGSQAEMTMIFSISGIIVFGVLTVMLAICFAFAVCLIVGLCKRRANLVKTYFVFGVIKMVFAVIGDIIIFSLSMYAPAILVLLILVVNVIYVLILVMIRNTYKKFEDEISFDSISNPLTPLHKC